MVAATIARCFVPTWAHCAWTGLKVECALDEGTYEKGIKVSDAEMASLDIEGDAFHPEWNDTVCPRPALNRSG
jgi:Rhodopirellula transposase DDE domain